MSALGALKPSTSAADGRPAASSPPVGDNPAAFSDVLKTLSAKSQSFGLPALAPTGAMCLNNDPLPAALPATNGAGKGFNDSGKIDGSNGPPAAKPPPASALDDVTGFSLAAMVQAAAASSAVPTQATAPTSAEGTSSQPAEAAGGASPLPSGSARLPSAPAMVPSTSNQVPAPAPNAPTQSAGVLAQVQTTPGQAQAAPPQNPSESAQPPVDTPPASAPPMQTLAGVAQAPSKVAEASTTSVQADTGLVPAPIAPAGLSSSGTVLPAASTTGTGPTSTTGPAPSAPSGGAATVQGGSSDVQPVAQSATAAASAIPPQPKSPTAGPASGRVPAATPPSPASGTSAALAPVSSHVESSAGAKGGSSSGDSEPQKPPTLDASSPVQPTPSADAALGGTAAAQVAGALATLSQTLPVESSEPPPRDVSGQAVPTAPTGVSPTMASAVSPNGAREMVIKLDPEHLGTVEIKMRLNAGRLDIEIRVANAQTLDLLSRDRHVLSAAVEAAGGTREAFSLRGGTEPAPTRTQTGEGLGAGTGMDRNQGASSNASSERGGRGQTAAADTFDPHIKRDPDNAPLTPHVTRSLDGSLYV